MYQGGPAERERSSVDHCRERAVIVAFVFSVKVLMFDGAGTLVRWRNWLVDDVRRCLDLVCAWWLSVSGCSQSLFAARRR